MGARSKLRRPGLVRAAFCAGLLVSMATGASEVDFGELEAWLAAHADAPPDGLSPGRYGHGDLHDLARYLPPGYLDGFDFPELALDVVETARYRPHRIYREATERFVDRAR